MNNLQEGSRRVPPHLERLYVVPTRLLRPLAMDNEAVCVKAVRARLPAESSLSGAGNMNESQETVDAAGTGCIPLRWPAGTPGHIGFVPRFKIRQTVGYRENVLQLTTLRMMSTLLIMLMEPWTSPGGRP